MRAGAYLLSIAFALTALPAIAAAPPDTVHYQAVLRDGAGEPLDGDHDMVFRFYDLAAGGSEILVDEHLAAGSGAVAADGGMLSVALGGGAVSDGAGAGTYTTLAEVFRDHGAVWLQVEVGGEMLSPRVEVRAAPYAHNASSLGGRGASEYIDTALGAQVKAGDLTVRDLDLSGNTLTFGGGPLSLRYSGSGFELNDDLHVYRSGGPHLELHDPQPFIGEAVLRFSTSDGTADLSWSDLGSFDLTDTLGVDGAVIASGLVRAGTALESGGNAYINSDGPEGDGSLYFFENGFSAGEYLRWDDSEDRFAFSDTLYAADSFFPQLEIESTAAGDVDPGIRMSFPGGSEDLYWDRNALEFVMTDSLRVAGQLDVGTLATFGSYISVGSDVRANGNAYVNFDGPEGTSVLHFYDGGAPTGAYLLWNDADNQFEVSDVLHGPPGNNFHIRADSNTRVMIDDDDSTTGNLAEWFHDGATTNANKLAELQEDGDFRIRKTLSQNVAFDLAESFWASGPLGPGDLVRADPDRPGAVLRAVAGDAAVLGVVSELPGVLLGSAPFDTEALREVWGETVHESFLSEREVLRARVLDAEPDLRAAETAIALLEVQVADLDAALGLVEETMEMSSAGPGDAEGGTGAPSAPPGVPVRDETVGEHEASRAAVTDLRAEASGRKRDLADRLEGLALELFAEEHMVPVALAGRVPVNVDAGAAPIAVGDPLTAGPEPGRAVRADGAAPAIGIALEPLASGQGTVLAFIARFETSGGALGAMEERQSGLEAAVDERTPDPVTGIQSVPGNLQVVLDRGGDDASRFSIHRDGEDDGALADEIFRVDERGNVFARGAFRPHAMDLAEYFPVSEAFEAGDVLAVDVERPGQVRLAADAGDTAVIGVVSSDPGLLLGASVQRVASADAGLAALLADARAAGDADEESRIWSALETRFTETHAAVALAGTAPCKVDAGYGFIRPGDLLMSSPTPGHAMRADDPPPGAVIGKALEGLDDATGTIRILVLPPR